LKFLPHNSMTPQAGQGEGSGAPGLGEVPGFML